MNTELPDGVYPGFTPEGVEEWTRKTAHYRQLVLDALRGCVAGDFARWPIQRHGDLAFGMLHYSSAVESAVRTFLADNMPAADREADIDRAEPTFIGQDGEPRYMCDGHDLTRAEFERYMLDPWAPELH